MRSMVEGAGGAVSFISSLIGNNVAPASSAIAFAMVPLLRSAEEDQE